MIIYEVDICIQKSIYKEYIIWLNNHIEKMLKIDGFSHFEKYKTINEESVQHVIIHYYVENMKKLENYFSNFAKFMRNDGTELFKENITIKRRILKQCD